jgi:hypothetical protein
VSNRLRLAMMAAFLAARTLFAQWAPQNPSANQTIYYNGPVAVGTGTPETNPARIRTLQVSGTTGFAGNVFLGDWYGVPGGTMYLWPDPSGSYIQGTGAGINLRAQGGTIWLSNGSTVIDGLNFDPNTPDIALTVKGASTTSIKGALKVTDVTGASILYVRNDGKVGIGTSSPNNKLEIGSAALGTLTGTGVAVSNTAGNSVYGLGQSTTTRGRLAWFYNPTETDASLVLGTVGPQSLTLQDNGGKVGIGTLSPLVDLAIGGGLYGLQKGDASPNSGYLRFGDNTGWKFHIGRTRESAGAAVNTNTTGVLMTVQDNGNVGIGATDPAQRLEVRSSADMTFAGSPVTISVGDTNPYSTAQTGAGIVFTALYNSANQRTTIGAVSAVKESTADGNYAGALTFGTRTNPSGSQPIERMRIDSVGQVSIGGLPPGTLASDKLVVNGPIRATSVINAVYQDVAEWVPASEPMEPGTVVVIDVSSDNGVTPSSHAYDTSVAGVVSAQPGVLLGVGDVSKEKIATTGRVKVRVDATRTPIRRGDLLVSSDKPGVAMKSEPVDVAGVAMHRPGTVLGKALEPLASGEGEILVLLSLQ